MEGLTTAKLAHEGGVNVETIRYYERHGLLPKPPRTHSGYRIFSEDAVKRLRFIKHAQDLGFSLKEVKELLALRVIRPCAEVPLPLRLWIPCRLRLKARPILPGRNSPALSSGGLQFQPNGWKRETGW